MRENCTPGSAWGDEFKKPSRLGEGTGAKASATARLRKDYRFKARLYHPVRHVDGANHSHIPFERYADDAICHCRSAEEARSLRASLAKRFAACALMLHPEKTKIVYCKDDTDAATSQTIGSIFSAIRFGRGCRAGGRGSASRSVRRLAAKLSSRSGKLSDTGRSINAATRRWMILHGCSTVTSAAGSTTTAVTTSRPSIPPCATSTKFWHDGPIGSSSP